MNLNKKLTAVFPYTRGFIPEIISTLKVCFIVTLIFSYLKPFGLEASSTTIILGFGIAVFISALFNIIVSLYVVRNMINEEKWCVWKEIIRALTYLCINIIAIILYATYNFDINLHLVTIIRFIGVTIFLAIIPISLRVVNINNWLLRNKLKEAQQLNDMLKESPTEIKGKTIKKEDNPIELKSNIVNDIVKTTDDNLLFIEAEKNYIIITELIDNIPQTTLLRLSIIKALEQIESKTIIRCHRSFIVNLKLVKKVTGNSQGLKLMLNDSLKQIPVSRSYLKLVKEKLTTLK